ncbi:MAG: hypothetical protein U5K69_21240 [Balneolaceae bacterium]|nr:hypothetical protein [Balneolaceae bacterium]
MIYLILALEIIIGIALLFLSSYIKKKANNLADKSDLEELTEIVESVKKKYSDETELLKAELEVLTSKKTEIFNEEKEALLNFYFELNKWIWTKLNIQLADYNHLKVDELSKQIIEIHDTYNNVNVLFAKFRVLTQNEILIDKGQELILEVLKYHQFIESNMRDLKFSLGLEKGMFDVLTKYTEERREIPEDGRRFFKEISEYTSEEKEKVFDEFYDEKLKLFSKIVTLNKQFEELVKRHLYG